MDHLAPNPLTLLAPLSAWPGEKTPKSNLFLPFGNLLVLFGTVGTFGNLVGTLGTFLYFLKLLGTCRYFWAQNPPAQCEASATCELAPGARPANQI